MRAATLIHVAGILVGTPAVSPAATLTLQGEVPADESRHFILSFEVPEGVAEIEVRHDDLSAQNILDWGLFSPSGFRGWGGGNVEPAVVGTAAASRSYLAGPVPNGTWTVTVGKAKVVESPARYRVEIDLRTRPTLAPQPERGTYRHSPALEGTLRWYAGDFHVHSRESGDATAPLDEIARFAKSRGLDFVAISDHNTVSHLDFLADVQARNPNLLLIPSVEFTTYQGHANAVGATEFVDFRVGFDGATLDAALERFARQGAVFTINHPAVDLGDACIGCAWKQAVPAGQVGAVEIATGGWEQTGFLFTEAAIDFWERLSARGMHLTALGGSDDHRAGVGLGAFQSPIGDPTTMVMTSELSAPAIVQAVRDGRTVVKLQGPADPMIELSASGERRGDTVAAPRSLLTARVKGGLGHKVRFVRSGVPEPSVDIDADPFVLEREVTPPEAGEERWRADVMVDDRPRTVASHIWISRRLASRGCGCDAGGGSAAAGGLACLVARRARRLSGTVTKQVGAGVDATFHAG